MVAIVSVQPWTIFAIQESIGVSPQRRKECRVSVSLQERLQHRTMRLSTEARDDNENFVEKTILVCRFAAEAAPSWDKQLETSAFSAVNQFVEKYDLLSDE